MFKKSFSIRAMENILQLYPLPAAEMPLTGAYLSHQIRQHAEKTGKPYIYANFVASLDGRIAIPQPGGRGFAIPKTTANERDWRLYQELAAQADLILSTGGIGKSRLALRMAISGWVGRPWFSRHSRRSAKRGSSTRRIS